jgi:putative PIN family toxin of toxin-antitoxin system
VKVVFDTDILASALVFPGGRGEAALRRILEEQDQLVLSKPILDELLGVLGGKFARDREELAHVAVFLPDLGTFVKPRRKPRAVADDPDNRILECAIAGSADAIVTGDKALLALGAFRGVRVITPRDDLGGQPRPRPLGRSLPSMPA